MPPPNRQPRARSSYVAAASQRIKEWPDHPVWILFALVASVASVLGLALAVQAAWPAGDEVSDETIASSTQPASTSTESSEPSEAAPAGPTPTAPPESTETDDETTPEESETAQIPTGANSIDPSAEPVSLVGEISFPLDSDRFKFTAEKGDKFAVKVNSLNGTCQKLDKWELFGTILDSDEDAVGLVHQLYSNPGTRELLWNSRDCEAFGPWQVPSNGSYEFVLTAGDGAFLDESTGSYDLSFYLIPEDTVQIDLREGPVPLVGELSLPLDTDRFEFAAEKGDKFAVRVNSLNGTCQELDKWELFGTILDSEGDAADPLSPTGGHQLLWQGQDCEAFGPWQVPTDGVYEFVLIAGDGSFLDENTGSYDLTLSQVS